MENLGIVMMVLSAVLIGMFIGGVRADLKNKLELSVTCTEIARDLTPLVNHPFVKYRCGF